MKTKIIIALSFSAIILLGYFIYIILIAIASQKMPVVEMSKELKELEKIIQKETDGGSTFFEPIPEYEIENCNAIINIDLSIRNDSLTKSKESLDSYINTVNKRVNDRLIDKKCIDSLIIEVSAHNSQEKIDSLKSKHYRYSFPIK